MMRRPADQAKLLLLYFLRSSAAFASEPAKTASLKPLSTFPSILDGQINLRVARRNDIPNIQKCNLASLPENYNSYFYLNHLRSWPELALVMEHVPEGHEERTKRVSPLGGYNPNDSDLEVVGYVLGKVEQKPIFPTLMSSKRDYSTGSTHVTENLGHVTSLAILDSFRRRGLAGQLMEQLHHHMKECYNADAVGLHVRVSNVAAKNLYVDSMGYVISEVIQSYYQDGEDAYLMKKEFPNARKDEKMPNGSTRKRWLAALGAPTTPWKPGGGMQLPRKIPNLKSNVPFERDMEKQVLSR